MRSLRMLAVSILAATGLVTVGATNQSANAAGSLDMTFTHTSVMKLELFNAVGTVPTGNSRTVRLQYRNKTTDAWVTRKELTSTVSGSFNFQLNTGKTRYFRYYAPASGGQPSIKGNSRKITVVAQKVQYFAVTSYCPASGNNLVSYVADFYPSRPGRVVTFSTAVGELADSQDSNGIASVVANTGPNHFFGASVATASAYHDAPALPTTSFTYEVSACSPA